jgi:hypothetical protein
MCISKITLESAFNNSLLFIALQCIAIKGCFKAQHAPAVMNKKNVYATNVQFDNSAGIAVD